MMVISSDDFKTVFTIEGIGKRTAIIKTNPLFKGYVVSFYYDGYPDFEWKRGSHGIACDNCETLTQAKAKAYRYIAKDC